MQTETQAETTPSKPRYRTVQEVFNAVLDADTAGRQLYWDWDKRQPLD